MEILQSIGARLDDLFWSWATSYLNLGIVGLVLLAALAVGYVPFGSYMPVISKYVKAARLVAFLTFGLLCALLDRRAADDRAALAKTRNDLKFAKRQIDDLTGTEADAARLAREAKATVDDIRKKVTTYGLDFPPTIPPADAGKTGKAAVSCAPRRITVDQSRQLRDMAAGRLVPEHDRRSLVAVLRGIGKER